MLGLIPLFFIGRYYYQLAHEYDRNRWGFAFLGVGIAIVAQLLFGFCTGFLAAATGNLQWVENTIVISLLAIAFSVLAVVIVYKILEKNWSKNPKDSANNGLLDN